MPKDLIQITRGLKEELPQLMPGEMGLCTDTNEVFIGNGDGNENIPVRGDIIAGSITADKLADGAVTRWKLANGSVTSDALAEVSIKSEHIQPNAITAVKIASGAVTTGAIENDAVDTYKLADGAVTIDKIADDAVTEDKLADGCVTSDQIVDEAVTEEKLSTQLQDQLKKFDSELKSLAEQMKLPAYLSCYSKSVDEDSRCSIDISVDKESDQVDIDITEIGDMCVDRMFYEYVEAHKEFSVASGSTTKKIQGLSQFNEGVYVQAAMICNLPAGTATIDVLYKGYANGLPPSPDVCKYNAEDSTVSIFLGEAHCEKNDENWSNARTIQTPTAPIEKGTQKISLLNGKQ